MHAAKLSHSDRLKRVAKLLKSGRSYTTLEIIRKAKIAAVSAAVSELRSQGFEIDCQRKGDIWFYRMVKS